MRRPALFLAAIENRRSARKEEVRERLSLLRGPTDQLLSARAGALRCHFLVSAATRVAGFGEGSDIQVIVVGELYPESADGEAEACLRAYASEGIGFLDSLHGSFCLAVVDDRVGTVRFATDPVNSRKIMFSGDGEVAWLSTTHAFHFHPCSGRPDPAGLAHCLVNGVPMNGRTPFDGVRVLDRASIHEITERGITSQTYWQYYPLPRNDRSVESIKRDLGDALFSAVKRRLPSSGEVCLSLSGGYDSAAVLGALHQMAVSGVGCYTYKKPTETARSDADVAGHMAAIARYEHTKIDAYGDDVAKVIGENVRWGKGLTRLVVETDTWTHLSGLLGSDVGATFWVADECFGMNPPRTLVSEADVLNSLAFADWRSLGRLNELFPRSVAAQLGQALREDLETLVERNRAIPDLYVLRDYLYVDQRLPRLLSWREAFAERCGEVRNPLLDREILELRQHLPKHLTSGKILFKQTATELFPDLFAIDRAIAGTWHAGQWCREAARMQSEALAEMIRAHSSPLDSYLPPERLLRLIDDETGRAGTLRRHARKARTIKGRARKRFRTIGMPSPSPLRPQELRVDPAVFLIRAITLRELFRCWGGPDMRRGDDAS